jgi:hypothetical protein
MSKIIGTSTISKDISLDSTLMPLIEQITGKSQQEALEHFVIACYENFLDPQPILDAMFEAKKLQQGH